MTRGPFYLALSPPVHPLRLADRRDPAATTAAAGAQVPALVALVESQVTWLAVNRQAITPAGVQSVRWRVPPLLLSHPERSG